MTKQKMTGTERDGLIYPFDEIPEEGDWKEVSPGIFWVRLALPFDLNHINVWLLKDGDGWALVDTGISAESTREVWERIFEEKLQGKPLTKIFCTHLHPDHMGLAGWLTRKFRIKLWMSRAEYLLGRVLVADTTKAAPEVGVEFYRAAGFPQKVLDAYIQMFGSFGRAVSHIPDSYNRLVDGQSLTIGEHEWQVVIGEGHSPEHACLYNAEEKVFISGDQVLPRISSNVSLFPTEASSDPLSDWLASCHKLKSQLPDDLLVLPAHNEPFYGLHKRLSNLIDMHEKNLIALYDILDEPKRSIDVFPALFKRPIGRDNFFMATGESLAHLRCLEKRGQVSRTRDKDGVDWYKRL